MKDPIAKAAAHWLIELLTVEDVDALWPTFEEWYRTPEHQAAYLHVLRAWDAASDYVRWHRETLKT